MPITPTVIAPSLHVCPVCRGAIDQGRCTGCGIRTDAEAVGTLWWIDGEVHRLAGERRALVARVRPLRAWAAEASDQSPRAVFPAPSAGVCPVCDGAVANARCGRCDLDLSGSAGSQLWAIDSELHRLTSQRAAVLALGSTTAPPPRAAEPERWVPPPIVEPPLPPPFGPRPAPEPRSRAGAPPADSDEPAEPDPGSGARKVQYLLLGLGALCLVVATIAFGAMAWRQMGNSARGAVLAGATVAAAGLTLTAHRRNLRATAEALGVVALAAALVDVHAVRVGVLVDAPWWQVWAGGTAVVALLALLFDRVAPLVTARLGAVALAQLPLLIVAFGPEWDNTGVTVAIAVGQAAVTFGLLRAVGDRLQPRWLRVLPALVASASTMIGGLAALVIMGLAAADDATAIEGWTSLGSFIGTGVIAAGIAVTWGRTDRFVQELGSGTAAAIAIAAAWFGLSALGPVRPGWLVAALAGAVVTVLAMALPSRWWPAPVAVGVSTMCFWSLGGSPAVVEALTAAGRAASSPWTADLGTAARGLGTPARAIDLAPGLLALIAPTLVLGAAWWRRIFRPAVAAGLLGILVVATALIPLALDLPLWCAAVLPLAVGLVAMLVAAHRSAAAPVAVPVAAAALAIAGSWAAASATMTIVALAAVAAAGIVIALLGTGRNEAPPAVAGLVVALSSGLGLALAVAAARGATAPGAWLAATIVFAGVSALAWLLAGRARSDELRRPLLAALASLVELSSVGVHLVALAVIVERGDVDATAAALLTGVIALLAHACRPDRRLLLWPAVAEGLALIWLQLAVNEVAVIEAYTLPLAVLLLVVGYRALATDGARSSWDTVAPGVALAVAPTVILALVEGGTARPLTAVVAGALVLLLGARFRLQALVTIGSLAVGAVAASQLLPAASQLPKFLVFGAVGALLLAMGATFEQRRRDLTDIKDRFESLR